MFFFSSFLFTEFPAILMNLQTGKIEDSFHRYVRPTEKPVLTEFCRNLTGITQNSVNNAQTISYVLDEFDQWLKLNLKKRNLKLPKMLLNGIRYENSADCAFVTWGGDFDYFLDRECKRKFIINKPQYFNQWIDLKIIFINIFHIRLPFLNALQYLNMRFIGRNHSGLDDAKNTANMAYKLIQTNYKFYITNDLTPQLFAINFSY